MSSKTTRSCTQCTARTGAPTWGSLRPTTRTSFSPSTFPRASECLACLNLLTGLTSMEILLTLCLTKVFAGPWSRKLAQNLKGKSQCLEVRAFFCAVGRGAALLTSLYTEFFLFAPIPHLSCFLVLPLNLDFFWPPVVCTLFLLWAEEKPLGCSRIQNYGTWWI